MSYRNILKTPVCLSGVLMMKSFTAWPIKFWLIVESGTKFGSCFLTHRQEHSSRRSHSLPASEGCTLYFKVKDTHLPPCSLTIASGKIVNRESPAEKLTCSAREEWAELFKLPTGQLKFLDQFRLASASENPIISCQAVAELHLSPTSACVSWCSLLGFK